MDQLLDAARMAPSSSNKQQWHMVVVTDKVLQERLVPACGNQGFVAECSAFLVGVTEPKADYLAVDIAIALDHISLMAVELGLGTCWIGDFEPQSVKDILGIPRDREVPICMTLGYPAVAPKARSRKNPSELFRKDRWGIRWGE